MKGSEYIKKETQGEEVKITEEYKQKIGKIKELKKNFNDLSRQLISQSESYISGGPSKILGFDGVDTEIGLLDYDKQFTEVIKPEIEKWTKEADDLDVDKITDEGIPIYTQLLNAWNGELVIAIQWF